MTTWFLVEVAMKMGKHCWEKSRKLDIPNLPDYCTAQNPLTRLAYQWWEQSISFWGHYNALLKSAGRTVGVKITQDWKFSLTWQVHNIPPGVSYLLLRLRTGIRLLRTSLGRLPAFPMQARTSVLSLEKGHLGQCLETDSEAVWWMAASYLFYEKEFRRSVTIQDMYPSPAESTPAGPWSLGQEAEKQVR